jgi:hypothetical protein
MGQSNIGDIIRLYSAGMISRSSLESAIDACEPAPSEPGQGAPGPAEPIDLAPDESGTWRVPG